MTITGRREATPAELIEQALDEGYSLALVAHGTHDTDPGVQIVLASSHDGEVLGLAARQFADLVDPQPAKTGRDQRLPEVPPYAEAVADALVAARKRLEGPLPVQVRPLVERDAQVLGVTLGSILAREYLESRGAL